MSRFRKLSELCPSESWRKSDEYSTARAREREDWGGERGICEGCGGARARQADYATVRTVAIRRQHFPELLPSEFTRDTHILWGTGTLRRTGVSAPAFWRGFRHPSVARAAGSRGKMVEAAATTLLGRAAASLVSGRTEGATCFPWRARPGHCAGGERFAFRLSGTMIELALPVEAPFACQRTLHRSRDRRCAGPRHHEMGPQRDVRPLTIFLALSFADPSRRGNIVRGGNPRAGRSKSVLPGKM